MPTYSGILPAGSTLTVDYEPEDYAAISYSDGDIGVFDNGQKQSSDRSIGPFSADVGYSVSYTGWPDIFVTAGGGSVSHITLPLPDPAGMSTGQTAILHGNFAPDVQSVRLTVDYVNGAKAWTGDVVSASAPSDADGLPDGVRWWQS